MNIGMKSILVLIVLFALIACSDDTSENNDYIVFGRYFGMCGGDCFEVFKLSDGEMLEDTVVKYYMENYSFNSSIQYSDGLYQYAMNLLETVPSELMTGEVVELGCPDCYDQGGFYLSINKEGEISTYTIDPAETPDQSLDVLNYKANVALVLDSLN